MFWENSEGIIMTYYYLLLLLLFSLGPDSSLPLGVRKATSAFLSERIFQDRLHLSAVIRRNSSEASPSRVPPGWPRSRSPSPNFYILRIIIIWCFGDEKWLNISNYSQGVTRVLCNVVDSSLSVISVTERMRSRRFAPIPFRGGSPVPDWPRIPQNRLCRGSSVPNPRRRGDILT